jgi:Na+/H+ antiporter NhaA
VSVVEWLEHLLHPWTSFVIVPLFALANAGIPLTASALSAAATSRITLGVVLGLVVGKLVGVAGATWLAVRLRVGALPSDVTRRGVLGVAALAGIGFTVSIFVANLAFEGELLDLAKLGVLGASVMSAVVGLALLRGGDREPASANAAR